MRTAADNTTIVRLRGGRELAFFEYGDPRGRPVFYFHGTPSSRYEGALVADAAVRHGIRLFAIDRPGMGLSTFQPGRRFLDWPRDVEELADILGFERFGVAGHSGGGAFTFAVAWALAHRLDFAIAFCPWGPPTLASLAKDLNRVDRLFFAISQRIPTSMRLAFAPLGWMAKYSPQLFLEIMKRSVSAPDREVLERPALRKHFAEMVREAFRMGGRGAAWEALLCYRPWGFELRDISYPVHVWVGDNDIFISKEMADSMERELQHAHVHRLIGKGHLCIEHWDDAFAAVR